MRKYLIERLDLVGRTSFVGLVISSKEIGHRNLCGTSNIGAIAEKRLWTANLTPTKTSSCKPIDPL